MRVNELRDALAEMPGEMAVYLKDGKGVKSAEHIIRLNLVGAEQFCELITYGEDHTAQLEDSLIERETGFSDRNALIAAYKRLRDAT
jgi:hypothetical protein